MVVLVIIVLLAAVVFGWVQLRKHNESQSDAAVASCFDGERTLQLAVDPGVASTVEELAARYNDSNPVVRDQCITVAVQAKTTAQVIATLGTQPAEDVPAEDVPAGDVPAMWIAQSSADVAQAQAVQPDALSSSSRPLATSPVVLAMPVEQASALLELSWQDLPARQGSNELGLVLPTDENYGANTLALSAVVAAITNSGQTPLSADQASSAAAREGLSALRSGATAAAYPTVADSLAAISADNARPLAVPVTEQQLYQSTKDQKDPSVRGLSPLGTTPMADYPATVLGDAEADETLSRAASAFMEFARQPEQLDVLAAAGFQVDSVPSPSNDDTAVSFQVPASAMPQPGQAAVAIINPRGSVGEKIHATTILLDVSGSMREMDGGRTRMLNVTDALIAEVAALPDDAAVGLWRYSANLRGNLPYAVDVITGALAEPVDGADTRRAALETALALSNPISATHTYRSLEAAYASAVAGFRPAEANSVLLITDGPNDDQANLDSATMLQNLAASQDPERPVVVNIIVIAINPDMATLQAVADQTGGTLTAMPTSADAALAAAIQSSMG